jgi:hypothetical protein
LPPLRDDALAKLVRSSVQNIVLKLERDDLTLSRFAPFRNSNELNGIAFGIQTAGTGWSPMEDS